MHESRNRVSIDSGLTCNTNNIQKSLFEFDEPFLLPVSGDKKAL